MKSFNICVFFVLKFSETSGGKENTPQNITKHLSDNAVEEQDD